MSENTYKIAAAVLLCTTLVTGALALQYNTQFNTLEENYDLLLSELEDSTATVNILIDDGNTRQWFNDTRVPLGSSFLNATMVVSEVEVQGSEWGIFVFSIDEVGGDVNHFWVWDYHEEGWQMGPVGADQWTVHDGDILRWTYTSFE